MYLAKGIDLLEQLHELPADRAFNLIDSILIDDLVYVAKNEEAIAKLRGKWDQIYKRVDFSVLDDDVEDNQYYDGEDEKPEGYIPGNYIIPDENGYPGLRERPLG